MGNPGKVAELEDLTLTLASETGRMPIHTQTWLENTANLSQSVHFNYGIQITLLQVVEPSQGLL